MNWFWNWYNFFFIIIGSLMFDAFNKRFDAGKKMFNFFKLENSNRKWIIFVVWVCVYFLVFWGIDVINYGIRDGNIIFSIIDGLVFGSSFAFWTSVFKKQYN